ncbi:hypothetical protein [Kitasatospora sp. LaBMicrA B282]|uniref:hypothetical protein n=1 Tax=Kitasatospora sp. LaBMicrA B282 TaxID=3420949 RepID=UPI003D0DA7A8
MANGVFHTGYGITINLNLPDLGHPDHPGLLDEILQPVDERDRDLLECLDHHAGRVCRSEHADKSPWMFVSARRKHGRLVLVASHLPVTHKATPEESARHRAMKERIARCAEQHGLSAQDDDAESPDDELTFTGEAIDPTCRYGEETRTRSDPRTRRDRPDATGLCTFGQVPASLFARPRTSPTLNITAAQRQAAADQFRCPTWEIGPCSRCGAPIHRYGDRSVHACNPCRAALLSR